MITFTVDLEDPHENYDREGRYVLMTHRILGLCRQLKRRATFFTVGRVMDLSASLIKEIAADGHEIAYHSHAHVSLTQENPARFRAESARDKDRIEQLIGKPVIGFRAPRFSLTPQSKWTLDVLGELGFRYSSSIMPTHLSRFGFPEAKRTPFTWPNGMVELPLPVKEFDLRIEHNKKDLFHKALRIPYLGGIYLYALPSGMTRRWAEDANAQEILWTYTHPYDFDRKEKFSVMPHTSLPVSFILWMARRVAEGKLHRVLALPPAPPLGERLETLKLK